MIYVGIDIAKLNHYAAVISSDGVVTLLDLNIEKNFFANLGLTFHSWSPTASSVSANSFFRAPLKTSTDT